MCLAFDFLCQKLLERGRERDQFLAELRQKEPAPSQVLELRQTIQLLQERLEEREGERLYLLKLQAVLNSLTYQ